MASRFHGPLTRSRISHLALSVTLDKNEGTASCLFRGKTVLRIT